MLYLAIERIDRRAQTSICKNLTSGDEDKNECAVSAQFLM